ncbi:P-loop containing nucleoside triphosphate hydrolase protein [Cercophora scortea]|uniref:DNA repair protein RAD50 n=1 Tax=Cercophora scortea TaxID=314031 RepID=A0AAE0J1P4_9PEZI|nr:P-loop containing nucleoside triphosphate hydrolase protein [Cercophora scortea]
MSKIEKLSIMGVRSFGPRNPETIAFNTPLTLIVGYNGSGKTTIIECLKYATTGMLPPNSVRGAFLHDPNLVGEKEVQAQIRVSFRSTVGEALVVTRNLQLVVKKNTRTFKTLDGTLLLRHNGERQTISQRVVELDNLIPEKLGVSRSVLDNVIFCHQDESLWPMSEPSVLKKKFDEIFEALKYTKVIDSIKVLRKDTGTKLALLRSQETHDKANKERADRVDKLLNQLTREIQESRERCDELLAEMDEESVRIKEKYTQANSFLKIVNDLQTKTEKLEYKKGAVEELRLRIDELSEPDQVLRDMLDQYEKTIERTVADREQMTGQFHTLQAELKSAREAHTAKASEQGKHQSDKDKYERQLDIRYQMIQDAAQRHEIRGFDGDLDDHHIRAFYDRIQKAVLDKKRELERLQRDNAAAVDEKTSIVTELENRKATLIRDRSAAKQRITVIGKDSAKTQGELSSIDIDEGAVALLRTELKELEAKIETAKANDQVAELDSQIKATNDDIWNLEALGAKLSRELVECTRLASERAQLDLRKKQLTERRRDLEVLTNTWNQELTAILGPAWKPDTIENDFQAALKQQTAIVAEQRKQKDATQQELKQLEFKLSSARDRQTKTSTERSRCQSAVVNALKKVKADDEPDSMDVDADVDEYQSILEQVDEQLKQVETDISLFDHLKKFYSNVQVKATKHNKCATCDRDFKDNPAAKSKLLEKVVKQMSDDHMEDLESALRKHTEQLKALRDVRRQYDTYQRLGGEMPQLSKDINSIVSQKEDLVRRLEDQDLSFKEAEDKRQEIDALNKNVLKISQAHKDIVDSERQVERSQQTSGVTSRSAEEINDEQTTCAEKMRVAQAKLNKLSTERQRLKDQAAQLEVEKMELRHKISNAVQLLQRKTALQEAIQRHKEEQTQLRGTIHEADKDLESIEPEILSARNAFEAVRQQGRAKEQNISEERDEITNTANKLRMINNDIQDYLDRGGPSNLASNQRAIATLEASIATLEKDMRDLTVQINKMTKEIDNSDAKKRNISDNLTYRKNLRECETLEHEIEELDSRNAQEDYDRLVQEARVLEARRGKLGADRDRLLGSMSTKDQNFGELNQEYEIELKGARAKYKESHIKVETHKAAIDDLAVFSSVIDRAIMQYHSQKMEDINRSIGDLWQSTYQGTDIDTIQIRSDVETGSTGKRNYNYRVSMIKSDTEMDMRGRCSAGQKVLACIIIRLALAESFGLNCGLIALDEPTTNLDTDNIKSLAQSLHKLIKERESQGNLQLIVITHDEEFLKHMQCSDFCDDFFRVERDITQNSKITRESITRITE